jgi:hypothetical protein
VASVWAERGREAIEQTATKSPELFVATCARLIPRDVQLTVEQQQAPGNLNSEDWVLLRQVMDAIRKAIPDADAKSPSEVFQIVLSAIENYTRIAKKGKE